MTLSWSTATAFFTSLLTLLSPFTAWFGLKPAKPPAADGALVQTVDVMSFNVLYGGAGQRAMEPRKDAVVQTIRGAFAGETAKLPDSFGMQEVTPEWLAFLTDALPEYGVVNLGRDPGNQGESSPVFYLKERYALVDSGTFWLSDTPETPSNTWGAAFNRVCTWALLEDKQSGFRYAHFNAHLDHVSACAREKSAALIVRQIAALIPPTVGVVLTGDFNAMQCSRPYSVITRNGFFDTKAIADKSDCGGTFHNFQRLELLQILPIDFLFVSGHVRDVAFYKIVRDQADGIYPSDHYPVAARLTLAQTSA